jgi:SAM-dependent methyltransferase
MESERKQHWEKVYTTKQPNEVSWTQEVPTTSLMFIQSFHLSKSSPIIDIGGGDSTLIDFLLAEGYSDLTVLDISEASLERAKKRLGEKANQVHWIVSDITTFKPVRRYKLWHDRATFHFLTTHDQIQSYLKLANEAVDGYLAVGTFSENGPLKCSGLEIKQYSEKQLSEAFSDGFQKLKCIQHDHVTPFNTVQNFTFCSFEKKKN